MINNQRFYSLIMGWSQEPKWEHQNGFLLERQNDQPPRPSGLAWSPVWYPNAVEDTSDLGD